MNYRDMEIMTVLTRQLQPPQDDSLGALIEGLDKIGGLKEGDVLAVTSKIVSIYEGRAIAMSSIQDKDQLIISQAERYLPREMVPHNYAILTIKNHVLAPSAGIDESNGAAYYILLPAEPENITRAWRNILLHRYNLTNLGLILTDSRSTPLRLGVVGIGLAFAGFHPLRDYRGQPDLFGRPMKISQSNIVDSLAAVAVYAMGECAEQTPAAIIRGVDGLQFTDDDCSQELWLDQSDDIYEPLYHNFLPGGGMK